MVVTILALGIGANTAIFSAARAVFLRPLPYPDAARLTFVSRAYPGFPQGGGNFSYPAYRDMLQQNTSFDVLAAYQDFGALALTDGDEPVRVRISYITPSYFDLFGVQMAVGRTFSHDEDRVGDGDFVTVLSHALWQRNMAAPATSSARRCTSISMRLPSSAWPHNRFAMRSRSTKIPSRLMHGCRSAWRTR